MGCLPILLLFPAGSGVGYLVGGQSGALWGAAAGLVLGLASTALFVRALRGKR